MEKKPKNKWVYLVYVLPVVVICYLAYNGITTTLEKRIVGKWKLVDIVVKDQEKRQLDKLTPELQKKLEEIKKMYLQENNVLTLQFGEDKKMTVISAKGKPRPYKIIEDNLLDVEDAAGEISIKKAFSFTFKDKLEIAITSLENEHTIVLVLQMQA